MTWVLESNASTEAGGCPPTFDYVTVVCITVVSAEVNITVPLSQYPHSHKVVTELLPPSTFPFKSLFCIWDN